MLLRWVQASSAFMESSQVKSTSKSNETQEKKKKKKKTPPFWQGFSSEVCHIKNLEKKKKRKKNSCIYKRKLNDKNFS